MIYSNIDLEKRLWKENKKFVAGVDEAGRGPWAGPVTAGAVVLNPDKCNLIEGITDSKKLSEKKREQLYEKIITSVLAWGVGIVDSKEIDRIGIAKAVNIAMTTAVKEAEKKLNTRCDFLIIDGKNVRSIELYEQLKEDKADLNHYSVACGAILAKVTRDRIMYEYAKEYKDFGFEKHVGYGTKLHIESLKLVGPCKIHRFTYKPIRELVEKTPAEQKNNWKYWREFSN